MTSRLASVFVFTALHAAHPSVGCALLYVGLRKFETARVSRFVVAELLLLLALHGWLWLFLFALLYFDSKRSAAQGRCS
jgi:hypothetical protein